MCLSAVRFVDRRSAPFREAKSCHALLGWARCAIRTESSPSTAAVRARRPGSHDQASALAPTEPACRSDQVPVSPASTRHRRGRRPRQQALPDGRAALRRRLRSAVPTGVLRPGRRVSRPRLLGSLSLTPCAQCARWDIRFATKADRPQRGTATITGSLGSMATEAHPPTSDGDGLVLAADARTNSKWSAGESLLRP